MRDRFLLVRLTAGLQDSRAGVRVQGRLFDSEP